MAQPFLKWAGGKRWLVRSGMLPVPESYGHYVEPFLGGGAVFFHLSPKKGVLSDANVELVNLYREIQQDPGYVTAGLRKHQELHSKEHYYCVREKEPDSPRERAVRFLYLNRACWNGLYRVNQMGKFNVPIGTKETVFFDYDDFHAVSAALQNLSIVCSDFEPVIDNAREGDFLFVDPPYTVKHNMNGFVRYNEDLFSWEDQERLHAAVVRAAGRGCFVAITNADHESVRDLYRQDADYQSVTRSSVISGTGGRRGPVTEAVFTFNL